MYQNYVIEVKKFANGEYEHQVFWLWDEDADTAMRKAKNKYYSILAEAQLSAMAEHAVILFTSQGFPVLNDCVVKQVVPAPVEEEVPEE